VRLGLLIYDGLDCVSGGYLYDRKLAQYLRSQGDEVEVISIPRRSYLRNLLDNFSPGLRRQLADARVDILLQDELCHPSLTWINRRRGEASGPAYPIVSIVHHLRSSELRPAWGNRLYRLIERRYLSDVDGYIFNSETTRRSVGRLVPDLEDRPSLVAYPAGDQFDPHISEGEIQGRVSQPGPLRLLFVGNVIPRKGLHTLLEVLAAPPRSGGSPLPRWKLSVVGDLQADRGYARKIARQIDRLGLAGVVELCGALPGADLAERMRGCHMLAVPSSYEGYGIAYLEGMGYGLPAIATAAGGAEEVITHGVDGYLLSPGDVSALQDCLCRLADDRAGLLEMSLAARKRYLAQPTWEQTGRGIRRYLESII
jgi:glycosyltransferase involved in cell wall biosynthesis